MATQTEVARHLSLTDRQLRRLQKLPGAPISNKRGQLDLDAWRDFYISYLRRSKNDVPDGDSEDDYEEKLLIARWELTAEQAVTQQLKNEVSKGKLIDTGFCIFALSKLAMALSSTLDSIPLNRPGFPGECFICELRLPDHRFRWKHNKLFLLLPEEYGPAFPAIVDYYTSPPT